MLVQVPHVWVGSDITVSQSLPRHVHVLTVLIGALLYIEWFSLQCPSRLFGSVLFQDVCWLLMFFL